MTTFWNQPRITLLGHNSFTAATHLPVDNPTGNDASDPELLAEYAGRVCYMSQANPAGRTTAQYIQNILQQQHGSVLEHATFSFLVEGVSRSLTHELIRHRAGTAVSQLSQRYVDASDTDFVIPPAMCGEEALEATFREDCLSALTRYSASVQRLELRYADEPSKTLRRKRAREAARSLLPNATETKLVWTANARALRHILELRGNLAADLEIQRFAVTLFLVLRPLAPSLFADFSIEADGALTCTHHKV